MPVILVINPGSTSTKTAIFDSQAAGGGPAAGERKAPAERVGEAITAEGDRLAGLIIFLDRHQISRIDCIAARGGLVRPVSAGIYPVNQRMLADLERNRYGTHASNLGATLADAVAKRYGCPAVIADPVGVDEFWPPARFSGYPGIERRSRSHALNIRATARRAACELAKPLHELNAVVVHLGGGISVASMREGRIVDVNDSSEGGPFTPQRAGTLPVLQLVELCYSGRFESAAALIDELTRRAGLNGYLGTDDGQEIIRRIAEGDSRSVEVMQAMAYQIAKEIGAAAAALSGRVDAIIVTGGLARPPLLEWILDRVGWIAPCTVYPGESEMLALAEAADRFLQGEEEAKEY